MDKNDLEIMQYKLNRIKENISSIDYNEKEINCRTSKKNRIHKSVYREIDKVKHPFRTKIIEKEKAIFGIAILMVIVTGIFSTSIFAKTITEKKKINEENELISNEEVITEPKKEDDNNKKSQINEEFIIEENNNVINLEEVLLENVSVLKSKIYVEEERDIEFAIEYRENNTLPKGEEKIVQEGKNGIKKVNTVKYYENNEYISEDILDENTIIEPEVQVIDVGTSEFLKKCNIHIGDKVYLSENTDLKEKNDVNSNSIINIDQDLDVKLEELCSEEWCKISYDTYNGYIETKYLTTESLDSNIIEKNRIKKIKKSLNQDIALNQSTDLTIDDYKKILTNNLSDTNNIICKNYEVFYNVDKKYNINGVFVAAIAIHESGWGTSKISQDKNNLFGYGAYDSSPYESSFSFNDYANGIETVAKTLVKYYLNPVGTSIYDGEIAKGSYYNGNTVIAVNVRYASDENWHNKVYKYMEYLYNRL